MKLNKPELNNEAYANLIIGNNMYHLKGCIEINKQNQIIGYFLEPSHNNEVIMEGYLSKQISKQTKYKTNAKITMRTVSDVPELDGIVMKMEKDEGWKFHGNYEGGLVQKLNNKPNTGGAFLQITDTEYSEQR